MKNWCELEQEILQEFVERAPLQLGYYFQLFATLQGGPSYTAARFPVDERSDGQAWLEANDPESNRRLGRGPGRIAGDPRLPDALIQRWFAEGLSNRAIERRTGIGRNRIARLRLKRATGSSTA